MASHEGFCSKVPPRGVLAGLARDRRGALAVMLALMLPVMLGFVGLGVEVGFWYQARRDLQSAADAAAIGGAYDVKDGSSSVTIQTTATTEATRNGLDTGAGETIAVNYQYPASGSYTADGNAVEVLLTQPITLMFSKVVAAFYGGGTVGTSVTVNVRAVATLATIGEACVLSLDSTGSSAAVGGNGDLTLDDCQIASNSEDSDAIASTGSGSLTADCAYTAGGVADTSQMTYDAGCALQTNASPLPDPYLTLTAPGGTCAAGYESGYTHNVATSVLIGHPVGSPDYVNPFVICGALWIKDGTVTLNPGLYVIDGGDLKSNASGNFVGVGVTIVLKNEAQINNFNGSLTVTLSAPAPADGAGVWQGILFYQDRDTSSVCTGNNCNTLNGNLSSTFQGAVYFPNQELNVLGGNTTASSCLQIVTLRVSFSGNSNVNVDGSACAAAGVPSIDIQAVRLVE